jgi:hypothetical protein
MFHLGDRIVNAKSILADSTIRSMHRPRTPGDTTRGYGLGWAVDDDHGYRRVSHTGGMPGVATRLDLYPAQDVAVVVLANQSIALPHQIASQIESVLLPGRGEAIVAERAAQQGRSRASASPSELIGDWAGTVRTYQGSVPITLRVKADEILVRLGAPGSLWTLVNRADFQNQLLSGQFVGTIPTADAMRHPHNVGMSLWFADGMLRGWVAAISTDRPVSGAVSSYAELTRQTEAAAR